MTSEPVHKLQSAMEHAMSKGSPFATDSLPRPAHEISVAAMFLQTWPNTAVGHRSMIAGQAFTDAYTIVLQCDRTYAVYFDGRFAYALSVATHRTDDFVRDMRGGYLPDVEDSIHYRKAGVV